MNLHTSISTSTSIPLTTTSTTSTTSTIKRTFTFLRHAERYDQTNPIRYILFYYLTFGTDTPLTSNGFKQTIEKAKGLLSSNVKKIISSPYLRTLQTATTIKDTLGEDIPMIVDKRFVELERFGENKNLLYPTGFNITNSIKIESDEQLYDRVQKMWNMLLQNEQQNTVIVSHSYFILALYDYLNGVKYRNTTLLEKFKLWMHLPYLIKLEVTVNEDGSLEIKKDW
jgi:broad specificity phosphatase PhoE